MICTGNQHEITNLGKCHGRLRAIAQGLATGWALVRSRCPGLIHPGFQMGREAAAAALLPAALAETVSAGEASLAALAAAVEMNGRKGCWSCVRC